MNSNVIQKGKEPPTKVYYLAWLIGMIIAVGVMIKKNYKKIDWHILIPSWWAALISSFLWQFVHNYYPGDSAVSGWMFYREMVITDKLFFGGVLEDILIFHPIGLMFGFLLALQVFQIHKITNKKYYILDSIFMYLLIAVVVFFSLFIDISSRISFFIFAIPGIAGMIYGQKIINFTRFFLFFVAMLAFTFLWDFTSVYLPSKIWGDYARCWFYIKDGIHSVLYNKNFFILGQMPVSIDVIYPATGMLFVAGITSFLKTIRSRFTGN